MSNSIPQSPSVLRVGLSAGKSLLGGLMLGLFFALILGFPAFFYYLMRLHGPGMPAAAHAGGWGAIVALVTSPPLMVATLLVFIIPTYVMVGLMIGRARATGKIVKQYGQSVSQRLAEIIATRIESMPSAHQALHKTSDLIAPNAAAEQLKPWVGDSRAMQWTVRKVVQRLPLSDLTENWNDTRAKLGTQAVQNDPALRAFFSEKILGVLQELAAPPWALLWLLLAAHVTILGVGVWITSPSM